MNVLKKLKKVYSKIQYPLAFGLWAFDFVTDILTVISYWQTQSRTVAILATAILATSLVVSIVFVPLLVIKFLREIREEKDHEDQEEDKDDCSLIDRLELTEAIVESIPQLAINLYVLSSCGQIVPTLQYISAFASFISVCFCIVSVDHVAMQRKEFKNFNTGIKWCFFVTMMLSKFFCLAARILVIVFFIFYFNWWIALPLAVHVIGLSVFFYNRESDRSKSNVYKVVKCFLQGLYHVFVWLGKQSSKYLTLTFSFLYTIENAILLAVTSTLKSDEVGYCLYSYVWLTQLELNLGCLIFAFFSTWARYKEESAMKSRQEASRIISISYERRRSQQDQNSGGIYQDGPLPAVTTRL